jgi:hypothetical protein
MSIRSTGPKEARTELTGGRRRWPPRASPPRPSPPLETRLGVKAAAVRGVSDAVAQGGLGVSGLSAARWNNDGPDGA